ncbi:hypothetical protein [Streptomyces sp. NPDC048277]|uniref:hypothetical protein n=1 Tax=Streptomyces sp. NPDC048277 TaxID=3155027 RepID=UPI0033CB09E7
MTDWIPQLRPGAELLPCFRCEKPVEEQGDKFCPHCAMDLGYMPIGDRDPIE